MKVGDTLRGEVIFAIPALYALLDMYPPKGDR